MFRKLTAFPNGKIVVDGKYEISNHKKFTSSKTMTFKPEVNNGDSNLVYIDRVGFGLNDPIYSIHSRHQSS